MWRGARGGTGARRRGGRGLRTSEARRLAALALRRLTALNPPIAHPPARPPNARPPTPGVAFSRLTPAGAVSGAPLRAARLGAAAVDAPAAAGGYRLWGDRTAADVMGSNVYVAAPYAAAGGWGTRVALLPQP